MTSSKLKPLLFICLASALTSCAKGPIEHTVTQQIKEQPAPTRVITEYSAQALYQQAQHEQGKSQQNLLLRAAKQALLEKNNKLALAITENLKESRYTSVREENLALLLEAYIANNELQHANNLVENTQINDVDKNSRAHFLWQSALLQSKQKSHLAASESLLLLGSYANTAKFEGYGDTLWASLSVLNDAELESLKVNAKQPSLAWINLAQLTRTHLGDKSSLQVAFADWQRRYSNMSSLEMLPKAIQQLFDFTPFSPQKIAVLLPLKGQIRTQAQAIQYGLLAAASKTQTELVFIDSQQDIEALKSSINLAQADFVIGPLLKDKVDSISNEADWPWPTLFLNTPSQSKIAQGDKFYFSLSMEDEASQMVSLFKQKGYQRPVVIHASNNIAMRMQQHFQAKWQELGYSLESYKFNNKGDLEQLVSKLLETPHSEERVKKINNLAGMTLEAQVHSRQDIDAIYFIADTAQTQMFKPFVDVSISPTAPKIPIYASSRSHAINLSSTDLRDLNGITFTEMPWMLSEQNSLTLRKEYLSLFKDQEETIQRLFAMGYDAFTLINNLKQQQHMPGAIFPGLTGKITLNSDGSLVRQLSWAMYRNNRITSVREP